MTDAQWKNTKIDDEDYRDRLRRLKRLGVSIGCVNDPSTEREVFSLKPSQDTPAVLYELPCDEVGLVAPFRLTVLCTQILMGSHQVSTSLDDRPLELTDPGDWRYYTTRLMPFLACDLLICGPRFSTLC